MARQCLTLCCLLLDSEIVGRDEKMDGVEVVFSAFGERQGFAHQAAHALAQGAEPTLHVAGLPLPLGAATVRSGRESRLVGPPKIAAGGAPPPARRQRSAQVRCALFAAVTQRPSDDLASAAAKRHPQPERLRLGLHKAPEFIEFKHVTLFAGQERVHEGRKALCFFPPATSSRSGNKPRRSSGCHVNSCGLGRRRAPPP